ncbi:MAG: carboxypeptidase-like regulatory domain-containing protein, partial [Bacteroidota bacterium]
MSAQNATLTGSISDSLGKPLLGVSIGVFGEPIGTSSDEKGEYILNVPAEKALKIVFSFTGFSADTIRLKLKEGETRKIDRRLRGAVYQFQDVTIEEKSLRDNNVKSIDPKLIS